MQLTDAVDALLASFPPATTDMTTFLGAQFDAGLAWVHFPEGKGGRAAPVALQADVDRRLREADAPSGRMLNTTAYGQGAATILAYGSDTQQQHYLRRILTCEDIWCQLFSEPGAGSDLAGLATRAVRDGDEWVIDGQKVWTTRGHLARYGLLLARTDADVAKHAGLTYFVLDMHQPGVTVRPLRQMDGGSSFNEVFIAGARIPDDERLGDVGQGWAVSTTTLMNERYNFGDTPARGSGVIAGAVQARRAIAPTRRREALARSAMGSCSSGSTTRLSVSPRCPPRRRASGAAPAPRARSASWQDPSSVNGSPRSPSTSSPRLAP